MEFTKNTSIIKWYLEDSMKMENRQEFGKYKE
jgi:hypothetical protein